MRNTLRWRMAIIICVAIAVSYLDRQTLPVAQNAIRQDIAMSNEQFSDVVGAFLLAYAFMYAAGGKLMDLFGTRRGFLGIMVFWSFACASQGLATSIAMLTASRFLLGLGEGGAFPAATRAVTEWFPVKERSTAMGIINAGTALGGIVAPPLVAGVITVTGNWRLLFYLAGLLGLAWGVWWWRSYRLPAEHPKLSAEEREHLQSVIHDSGAHGEKISWLSLLRYRETWAVVVAKFLSDASWYFYLFWLPKYLTDARHFDIKAVGAFAWIPPAAAGVGCLVGGSLSSWLLHKNYSVNTARKIALGASAIIMPLIWLVPSVPNGWMIALFSVAYFGQQSWSTLVMILPTDLFPRKVVGAVAGLVGFGGAMGGVVFGRVVGWLLDHNYGWGVVFGLSGSFYLLAFAIICLAIPRIRPVNLSVSHPA